MLCTGGYAVGLQPASLLREAILQLCIQLKPEAVALADVLAPPDFILNSVLGSSDGNVSTVAWVCLNLLSIKVSTSLITF